MTKIELTNYQKDTLKEIGNIGIGKGATALSNMISKTVDISIPEFNIISITDLFKYNNTYSISCMGVNGEFKGFLLGIFPYKESLRIVDLLFSKKIGETKKMDEKSISAFNEMVNVVGGNYLTALSEFLGVNLMPNSPCFISGTYPNLIDEINSKINKYNLSMYIKTEMHIDKQSIHGSIIYVADEKTIKDILNKMA